MRETTTDTADMKKMHDAVESVKAEIVEVGRLGRKAFIHSFIK
jgi:hypothetical protein